MSLVLSPLPKTWIFDVDGTIVRHNGYLTEKGDELLPGVRDFFAQIPDNDMIILLTARRREFVSKLREFLKGQGIKFDYILSDIPQGERILINDVKPSGLKTALSVNKVRDAPLDIIFEIDESL
mgnify:FL=1|jgi:FMN phosphatase YigB (HAD superfamily)